MDPSVTSIGFKPAAEFLCILREKLTQLADMCPHDSGLSVRLVRRPKLYVVSIAIRFVGGAMEAESHSPLLMKSLTLSLGKIQSQIRSWHTARFAAERADEESSQAVKSHTSTPSVLIIDDDPASTQLLDFCLRKSGCATRSVSSGYSAIAAIASQRYDLVFLDWNMPEMNGGETLLSAQNLISYDRVLSRQFSKLKMPVITYSGQPKKDLNLPPCDYFRFVDHWDKSTPFHQLLTQASDVLFRFKTVESSV